MCLCSLLASLVSVFLFLGLLSSPQRMAFLWAICGEDATWHHLLIFLKNCRPFWNKQKACDRELLRLWVKTETWESESQFSHLVESCPKKLRMLIVRLLHKVKSGCYVVSCSSLRASSWCPCLSQGMEMHFLFILGPLSFWLQCLQKEGSVWWAPESKCFYDCSSNPAQVISRIIHWDQDVFLFNAQKGATIENGRSCYSWQVITFLFSKSVLCLGGPLEWALPCLPDSPFCLAVVQRCFWSFWKLRSCWHYWLFFLLMVLWSPMVLAKV